MGFWGVLIDFARGQSIYSVYFYGCVLCVHACSKKDVRQMRQNASMVRLRPLSVACLCVNSLISFLGENGVRVNV